VITLVLGGARSGKSLVAERLASRSAMGVTYVATVSVGEDVDLAARVAAHQRRRLTHWVTIECEEDLAGVLERTPGTVLVDSLGPWLAAWSAPGPDVERLCAVLVGRADDTIIVSEEVGLGVHPSTTMGREFRDALGELNQAVASVADEVLFVIAGCVLRLEPGDF
jgi:adenosylcobinamide kinase/adenosylcobinamide-phosphate guanylyltransferase